MSAAPSKPWPIRRRSPQIARVSNGNHPANPKQHKHAYVNDNQDPRAVEARMALRLVYQLAGAKQKHPENMTCAGLAGPAAARPARYQAGSRA